MGFLKMMRNKCVLIGRDTPCFESSKRKPKLRGHASYRREDHRNEIARVYRLRS